MAHNKEPMSYPLSVYQMERTLSIANVWRMALEYICFWIKMR